MSLLRFAAILALALWIGGLVTLGGVAASTLFDVLQARDPASGRDLAGVLFGAILERFHYVSWAAGAVLFVSLGIRAALGPRPRRWGLRMWIAAAMLAASVASVMAISPRIAAIRASAPTSIVPLPDENPRRIHFGSGHRLSRELMLPTIAGGIGLLWKETSNN